MKPFLETSKIKTKSLNSITLRTYAFSRILIENFGFTFTFKREQRKATRSISYFPIEKIYDEEYKIVYDENEIELVGIQKTKYCKVRVLDDLINFLKDRNYNFVVGKTNKAKKPNGKYPAITIEKIKGFSRLFNEKIFSFDMQEIEEKLGYCMLDTLKCAFNKSTQKIILSKTFSNDTLSLFKPQQNIQFIVLPHYHFLIEHYFITHQYHNLNLINPSSIQPPFIFSQPNTHISHLQQLPQNTIQMLYPIGTNQQPFQHQQVLSCYDFTNVECSDSFSTHHSFQSNDSYNYCNPKMFYERETPNHFSSDYNEIGSIEDYSNQAERKEIFEMTNNGTPVSMLSPVDNTFTPNVSTDSPTYELKFCFKEIHSK